MAPSRLLSPGGGPILRVLLKAQLQSAVCTPEGQHQRAKSAAKRRRAPQGAANTLTSGPNHDARAPRTAAKHRELPQT
eukprot:15451900-Alexandrium_andersonii.AAC.1